MLKKSRTHVAEAQGWREVSTLVSADRGFCSGLVGGHSLPMFGLSLFLEQVCSISIEQQKVAGHVCFQRLSWLLLHGAGTISRHTEQVLSSQSYPYLLHCPRLLPGLPGKITAHACPFPCPAGTQLCLDMSCWQQLEHWASDAGLMFSSRKQEKQPEEHTET